MSKDLAMVTEWLDRTQPSDAVVQFAKRLAGISEMDASGLNTAVLEIMHNILEAEGEEGVFAAANAGTESGKTFVDIPFRLPSDGIEWKQSGAMFREQGGFPFYTLLRVTRLDTGQPVVMTCGGFTVITTLWALWDQDILKKYDPAGGMPLVLKSRPASSGFDYLLVLKHHVPDAPAEPVKKTTKAARA